MGHAMDTIAQPGGKDVWRRGHFRDGEEKPNIEQSGSNPDKRKIGKGNRHERLRPLDRMKTRQTEEPIKDS